MVAKKAPRKEVRLVRAYRHVFATEEGKKVLYDLIRSGNMLNTSCSSSDPLKLAFNEGKRALVLRVLQQIETDPEALTQLLADSYQEEYLSE